MAHTSSVFLLLFVETSCPVISSGYEASNQAIGIKDNPASLDEFQVLWSYPPATPVSPAEKLCPS
jgi:hypothetical protein